MEISRKVEVAGCRIMCTASFFGADKKVQTFFLLRYLFFFSVLFPLLLFLLLSFFLSCLAPFVTIRFNKRLAPMKRPR